MSFHSFGWYILSYKKQNYFSINYFKRWYKCPRGTWFVFDKVCGLRSETLPISKDFSSSKLADFTVFFTIFTNWDPFHLKKCLFYFFVFVLFCLFVCLFVYFCKCNLGPISEDIFAKRDPYLRISCEKLTHFKHISIYLSMWVPPPVNASLINLWWLNAKIPHPAL